MTKKRRIVLTAAATWPTMYWAVFLFVWLPWWANIDARTSEPRPLIWSFLAVATLHLLTILLLLSLSIYAFVRVSRSDLDRDTKARWFLLIFFLFPLALPAFFWLEPTRGAKPAVAA